MSNIESVMHENRAFPPAAATIAQANVRPADFDAMNAKAARDFEGFRGEFARETLAWHKPFTRVLALQERIIASGRRAGARRAKGDTITQDASTLENPAILEQLKQTI